MEEKLRILLCEDDENLGTLTREYLEDKGYKADLIVVDISGPNWTACDDIANGLVYSADGKDVCLTMCDGMTVYRDGEYTFIDIEKTIAETENAKAEILKRL